MKKPTIAGGLFIHGMLQMVEMGESSFPYI
jgi:hypothetical protein